MPNTPGSFTKNLGFGDDCNRLRQAIRDGFGNRPHPIKRRDWVSNTGLRGNALVALNFFLHSQEREDADYVLVDQLVSHALRSPYDKTFERLAVFSLHLASSGAWQRSQWPDGRVGGWSNEFIRRVAWRNGRWNRQAFSEETVDGFLKDHVLAMPDSITKMRNNYLYLLEVAGVLENDPIELEPWLWGGEASMVFWDRLIYQGTLDQKCNKTDLLNAFLKHEIYKLLSATEDQGLAIAESVIDEYLLAGTTKRFIQ